jgi:hypothetical protein
LLDGVWPQSDRGHQRLKSRAPRGDALHALVLANGAYDVACAACILWLPWSRLGRLHLGVFKEPGTPAAVRVLAYWTYGLGRLVAGACATSATDAVAALSYLAEGAAYFAEKHVFASADAGKAGFVWVSSFLMCAAVCACV